MGFRMKKKKEKLTLRGMALRDKDYPLWLAVFSAIFGVLNQRLLFGRAAAASPIAVITGLIFIGFWMYMALTAGIVRSRGFLVAYAVIWGMALLYLLLNLVYIDNLPKGTKLSDITSLILLIMMAFAISTVLPLIPAVAYVSGSGAGISIESGGREIGEGFVPGQFPLNSAGFLTVGLCAAALIAIAYFVGVRLDKKDMEKKNNKA
jgi:hypothetical protein